MTSKTTLKRGLVQFGSAASVLALAIGFGAPAQAQDNAGERISLLGDIENITVTARRKEESLLETPLSVSAFSAEAIFQAGLLDFDDIILQAPGVFNSNVTGRSDRVTIRGVSQVSTTGGSNVGIFIDGVIVQGPVSALELEMLERVEIIKGPQSTQFGRGTLAGAVNYVTRRPSDEFGGQINALVATQGEYNVNGYVTGPVADSLSLLAGFNYYKLDSLFFNAFEGREDMGGRENYSGSFGALFEPADNLSFYLRATYYEQKDDPIGIYTQGPEFNNCNLNTPRQYFCGVIDIDYDNIRNITRAVEAPAGSTGQFQYPGRRGSQGYIGGEAGTDRDSFRIALISNLDFDFADIQLITSYQKEDERWGSDATNRAITSSVFLPNGPAVDISREWEDFSQEVRLRKSFLDDRVEFLVGGYYFEVDRTEVATYIPEDRGTFTEKNLAGFASLEIDVTDWFTITGELRTQRDKVRLTSAAGVVNGEETYNATLPRINLAFKPMDDLLIYAQYSKGNKPGNFNTRLELIQFAPELVPIDEEELEMFELGVKGTAFDGRMVFTLAGYKINWTGQQLTQQIELDINPDPDVVDLGSFTYTDNVGESTIWGFEAEITASIVPNIFDIRLSAAHADAQIDVFDVVGSATVEAEARGFGFPNSAEGVLVSGTPLPASPDWTLGATASFNYPITDEWESFARADYVWIDEQFASIFGQASSGSRTKLDLRAGVENGTFRLEAFAVNLTQDRSPISVLRTIRFDGGFAGTQRSFSGVLQKPRQFGLRGTFKF